MNKDTLEHCDSAAFAGTMTFPETVRHMHENGVEWYLADLLAGSKQHYSREGSTTLVTWRDWTTPNVAEAFDAAGVVSAIRNSQQGRCTYPEFLQAIAAAGVTHYTVHMGGRRAVYTGRHGDSHVEHFPQ